MVILRRPDLDMTDEEFKEYLEKSISDEDIKQMFDCLTPDYIIPGDELTDLLELYSGTPTSILRTLSELDGGTVSSQVTVSVTCFTQCFVTFKNHIGAQLVKESEHMLNRHF